MHVMCMRGLAVAGFVLAVVAVCGCYEPLDDPCRDRECGRGCGTCPERQACNHNGVCVDACPGRECGPSPVDEQVSCGKCPEGQACGADGRCTESCPVELCPDGSCPGLDGCCLDEDCGPGSWTCRDNICGCDLAPCEDGFCPTEDQCCTDADCDGEACRPDHTCGGCARPLCDDGYCPGPGECCTHTDCDDASVCEDHACVTGEAGALRIDGLFCTLDGAVCPPGVLSSDATVWTLLDDGRIFSDVTVTGTATLTAPAIDAGGGGGRLTLRATGTVRVESTGAISMSGRGWGGGGGGGGTQYCANGVNPVCSWGDGGAIGVGPNGEPGTDGDETHCSLAGSYQGDSAGAGSGGGGGGHGGRPGQPGSCSHACSGDLPYEAGDGTGGDGGGPYGGEGGDGLGYGNTCEDWAHCDDVEGPTGDPVRESPRPAGSGVRGGYAGPAGNNDSSTDDMVRIGSGGGGGAGGDKSGGWCCGAADGGHGGAAGGIGRPGCTGGGGGGGGGAGGGAIEIRARRIVVAGAVTADGAGRAELRGGYGAGGGILLHARESIEIQPDSTVRTLGGYGDGSGSAINGGTIKLFYRALQGTPPVAGPDAGRVYEHQHD